jgi:drug/metabolite transporter (DMT)-like permease
LKPRDLVDLILLAAIWGASFLFMRVAAPEFGPIALIAVRVALAAALLIPIALWHGHGPALAAQPGQFAWVGLLNSALPFTLLAYATLSLTAGFVSVLNATVPLFTALVAYVWMREGLTRDRALGLALGFVGVLLLAWDRLAVGGLTRGGQPTAAWAPLIAMGAALIATLSYGVAAIFTRRNMTGVAPLASATGSQIGAALALAPLAWIYWPSSLPSVTAWLSVVMLGSVCTALAYILYFRLINHVGAARAVSVTFLIPAFAMVWGRTFLAEIVTAKMLAACAVILTGTALSTGLLRWPTRGQSQ